MSGREQEPELVTLRSGRRLLFVLRREDGDYPPAGGDTLLIIDDRAAKDPSFCIVDSCRIVRRRERREILLAVMDYNARVPSQGAARWRRTLRSMEREWIIHNAAHRMGVFLRHARDVDLNNAEEGKSWGHFVGRGLVLIGRRARRLLAGNPRARTQAGRDGGSPCN